jgi:hypothetical protein
VFFSNPMGRYRIPVVVNVLLVNNGRQILILERIVEEYEWGVPAGKL